MRKTISLLLVLVMILSLSGGVTAFAEELGGVDQQLVEQVVEPTSGLEQSPEQNTENDPAQSPVEDPAENTEQDPAGDPETKTETETGTEPKSETETGEANEETGEPNETSDELDASDEIELISLDGADEELALDGADDLYTEIKSLAEKKTYVAVVIGSQAWSLDMNQMGGVNVTVNAESKPKTCTIIKGMSITATQGTSGGYALALDDPPGEGNYLYVDETGKLTSIKAKGLNVEDYAKWSFDKGFLCYNNTYYLATFTTVTTDKTTAAKVALFTGDTASMGGGGGGSKVDADAPTITTQPTGGKIVEVNTAGTIELSVVANPPEGVEASHLTYQWTKNGVAIENATTATYTASTSEATCGIYTYRCEVTNMVTTTSTAEDGTETTTNTPHSVTSAPVAVIVYNGTKKPTDILMFSDVHQEPQNIADVLGAYMEHNANALPTFVVASGDYHNGGTETDEAVITASLNAIQNMLGGETSPLKVFWLAGNHESSPVIIDRNGAKTGLIYKEGMYVYTINYDEIQNSSYESMLAKIKTALDSIITAGDEKKPVIFLAHAGLHTLNGSKGGASYNINFSDELVNLFNEYAKRLKIFFFFGHNHSKDNETFFKTADDGSYIYSTHEYDSTSYNRQIGLNFTYGQMGYLNKGINGGETASVMRFTDNGITLQRIALDETTNKVIYSGAEVTAIAPGGKNVPVVKALEKRYDPGTTLMAEVEGEGDYAFQWYKSDVVDLTVANIEAIEGATEHSFKPDADGYYFCKVTRSGTDDKPASEFATTTVTLIGEAPVDTFAAGQYAIVLKDGDKSYAIMTDESGALSIEEVEVRGNEVVGPKSDFYLWDIRTAATGNLSILNMGSNFYLSRAGRGQTGLVTTQSTSDSYINAWNYDGALHILYNISTGGGSTKYYYPIISEGKLSISNVTALAEANIYLMKVGGGDAPAPNTDVNKIPVPNTADNGMAGIWAALALTASAAMTGAVVRKKKTEA